jgi:hypothetical protein
MDGRAVRRLVAAVRKIVDEHPPVLVLDLRETGETTTSMSLVHAMTRQARMDNSVPLWIVSEGELPPEEGVRHFVDVEDMFWKLEELRQRPRRRTRKAEAEATVFEDAAEADV